MIRSTKEVIRSLLKRAFAENRGAEVILLIQWRRAAVGHYAEKSIAELDKKIKLKEFNAQNPTTGSRTLDSFNLRNHMDNNVGRLSDNSLAPKKTFSEVVNEGNIRPDISFVQVLLKFNNMVLVQRTKSGGGHIYVAQPSTNRPSFY